MAQNDCLYLPSAEYQQDFGPDFKFWLVVICIPGVVITWVMALLILSKEKNRQRYPLNYIGYICLMQSGQMQILLFHGLAKEDFCQTPFNALLRNALISKGTAASELLGFHMTDVSSLTMGGLMNLFYVSFLLYFVSIEILFTLCINIDVVYTLVNPFSRNVILQKLNTFIKVGAVASLMFVVSFNVYILDFAKSQTFEMTDLSQINSMLDHHGSLHITFEEVAYPYFYLELLFSAAAVTTACFVAVLYSYIKMSGSMTSSSDVSRSIFRKQLVYFFFLNLFDFAHLISIILSSFEFQGLASTTVKRYEGMFFLIFSSRSIVLPLIRGLESTILNQCISRVKKVFKVKGHESCSDREEKISAEDPDIAFLCSSQNNLLVCSILTGINMTLQSDEQPDSKGHLHCKLDKIKILNPKLY